ncbi:MAG: 23S rRNA (uracil(1939)-C(5))-methyltransferase RlmD [Bacillota bacterium]
MPPLETGQTLVVEVGDVGHAGDGVARHCGYVLFIAGAATGDLVRVEVTAVGPAHGRARIVEILRPSPERSEPPCEYYGSCGGCQLQHICYRAELEYKRQWVRQAASRIGGVDHAPVEAVLSDGSPYGYRARARLAVAEGAGGEVTVGFRKCRSAEVVDVARCPIQVPRNGLILSGMRELIARGAMMLSDGDQLEIRSAGKDSLLVYIPEGGGRMDEESARLLLDRVPELTGIAVQTKGDAVTLAGRGEVAYCLDGLEMVASAPVFTQVNHRGARILYRRVVELAGLSEDDAVVELFSGVGGLTLHLAARAGAVFAVELHPGAIRDARRNAERNARRNVIHWQGDAADGLQQYLASCGRPEVLVMDPPRGGCPRPLLHLISGLQLRRIVYVSCDFGTWARDVGRLVAGGWRLRRAVPVDMFPETANVEIVSVFDAKGREED